MSKQVITVAKELQANPHKWEAQSELYYSLIANDYSEEEAIQEVMFYAFNR